VKAPQPFPYQGSKRNLAPLILPYIPKDCNIFWEPFAGSSAMSIAIATNKLARHHVINDINEPLSRLWRKIIESPKELSDAYEKIWRTQHGREMELFKEIRNLFNQFHLEEHLLFLLARCVKAAVRYNSRGEFNQSADPRRKGMIPATMRGNLLATSSLLRGKTKVFSMDYASLCGNAKSRDVIYMDPPYQGVCKERDCRYSSSLVYKNFVESLGKMNERGLSYIVSYDGRTGDKTYGDPLPDELGLELVELRAGRSSQATLLGRNHITFESLYMSRPLMRRLGGKTAIKPMQPLLV
jgi:DNA adenine methylase